MHLLIRICVEYPKVDDHRWYQLVQSLPFAPYEGLKLRVGGLDIELENVRFDVEGGTFVSEICDSTAFEEYRDGIHFHEAAMPLEKMYRDAGFETVGRK